MSFTSLLIHTCNIEAKTLTTTGYEKVPTWEATSEDVPCRKDSSTGVKITDSNIRLNTDDDMFFFLPDVEIVRGNRIAFEGDHYDVIKVNKLYDRSSLHHLEVIARNVDHK